MLGSTLPCAPRLPSTWAKSRGLLWFSKPRVCQLFPTLCPSPASSGIKDSERPEQLTDLGVWDHFSAEELSTERGSDVRRSKRGPSLHLSLVAPPVYVPSAPLALHNGVLRLPLFFSFEILPGSNIFISTVHTSVGRYNASSFTCKCRQIGTHLTPWVCVPSPQLEGVKTRRPPSPLLTISQHPWTQP